MYKEDNSGEADNNKGKGLLYNLFKKAIEVTAVNPKHKEEIFSLSIIIQQLSGSRNIQHLRQFDKNIELNQYGAVKLI
jgi:hypothetical protein